MWVVCDKPADFPESATARLWEVGAAGATATESLIVAPNLDALRGLLLEAAPGTVRLERAEEDDPVIVEVWV
jgi:hypothetical protein